MQSEILVFLVHFFDKFFSQPSLFFSSLDLFEFGLHDRVMVLSDHFQFTFKRFVLQFELLKSFVISFVLLLKLDLQIHYFLLSSQRVLIDSSSQFREYGLILLDHGFFLLAELLQSFFHLSFDYALCLLVVVLLLLVLFLQLLELPL